MPPCFTGWSPAVNEICTGEAAYTATYRAIKREELPGDTTGDGVLNNDDVVFLLWYTLFPGDYAVSCAADFNRDGSVTNDDVIYLLWHTLFGDQYPLP